MDDNKFEKMLYGLVMVVAIIFIVVMFALGIWWRP